MSAAHGDAEVDAGARAPGRRDARGACVESRSRRCVIAVAGCGGRVRTPAKDAARGRRDTIPPRVVPESLPPEKIEDVNAPQEPGARRQLAGGAHRARGRRAARHRLGHRRVEAVRQQTARARSLHGDGGEQWIIEPERGGLRASRAGRHAHRRSTAAVHLRSIVRGSFVIVNGKRYRGEIAVMPAPGGVTVINRLYMEDYLRGVVPLEIGQHRTEDERAAVEAQAVAARSYAYTHLVSERERRTTCSRRCSTRCTAARTPRCRSQIARCRAPRGWCSRTTGASSNAPYHSTCGGTTAAASEVWREGDEPYLVPVSDRIPGSADRYYCDPSPTFRWTRSYDQSSLRSALDKYLRNYAAVSSSGIGTVRSIESRARTPSGRVRTLGIGTSRGHFSLRQQRHSLRASLAPVARFSTARTFRWTAGRIPTAPSLRS